MYDSTLSVSKNCMEYRYNPPNTILVSFQTLDQNNVIQILMINEGSMPNKSKGCIYPESKNRLKINFERTS
jgi:hypothetical protein